MDERILRAARAVVAERGPGGLTLDRVAAAAGLSKGGLMHHVPTKRDLVRALVAAYVVGFDTEFERLGSDAGGYIAATFDRSPDDATRDATAGVLAAVADDPSSLEPLRERYAAWQRDIDRRSADPTMATVVRLAADGLWLAELLDLAPPAGRRRAEVRAVLEGLAGGSAR